MTNKRTAVRLLGAAMMTLAIAPWVGSTGAAQAADSVSTTVDIGAGETATKVGTATFTLTATKLTIESSYEAGVTLSESHACIDDEPFSERIPPGQCQFSNTTGDYDIALDTVDPPLTGTTVCAQVHYVVSGGAAGGEGSQTAYAGHEDDKEGFFGNVCLTLVPTTVTTTATETTSTSTSTTSSAPATTTTSAPATTTTTAVAAATTTTSEASVLPTKIGSSDSAAEETAVAVEGTKTGGEALAATGAGMPLGLALALSLGLLLGGATLLMVPGRLAVERGRHRRRH